jgi:hypothetical protein
LSSDRDGLQHESAADASVALAIIETNSASRRSHMAPRSLELHPAVLDTTLQNIRITHGGCKRSLAEGIRPTVRRGQTNPVWPLMVSCRVSLEVERLRWPQTSGNWYGKHGQVIKYCKAPWQTILEEGQHAVRLVLKNASQICRAVSVEPLLTSVLKVVSPDPRTLLRLLCWIVPLCYSRSIFTIQPLGGM